MEQLSFFDHRENLKQQIIEALLDFRFDAAEKDCVGLETYEPDWHLLAHAKRMIAFWKQHFPEKQKLTDSELMFTLWQRFQAHWLQSGFQTQDGYGPIYPQLKRRYYLDYLGLGSITPRLRHELHEVGTSPLELLVELEEWPRAYAELTKLEQEPGPEIDLDSKHFGLLAARVYYYNNEIYSSRGIILDLILRAPEILELETLFDRELLDHLADIRYLVPNDRTSVELVPYIGLMRDLFVQPVYPERMLAELEQKALIFERQGLPETERTDPERGRYWLFSVLTWAAHLSKRLGLPFLDYRRKMKELDPDLMEHYLEELERPHGS
ncbi:hypothetical protein JXQ70_14105 [bacterium]|nr:hypothetical protein [bacterium]